MNTNEINFSDIYIMELIIVLALLLIFYVVYSLFTRETFVSKSETENNINIFNYRTRKRNGGLKWDEYRNSENSYNKFKGGNSCYN